MADDSSWTPKQDMSLLCRVCANQHDYLIPIFEGEGLDHDMPTKMDKHLPIKVRENDKLPTQMCYQCASTIIAWSELVTNCLEADKKLSRMLKINEKKAGTVALVDEDATSDHYEDAYDDVGGGDDYDDAAADDEDFEKEIKQLISDAGVELGSKTTKAKTTRATTRKRKSETVIVKKESKKSKTDTSVGKSSISLIKPKEEVTASDDRCIEVWSCCTCERIFSSQSGLRTHIMSHAESYDSSKDKSDGICSACKVQLSNHYNEDKPKRGFTCYYCDEYLTEKRTLQLHMKIVHASQYLSRIPNWYTCRSCPNKLYKKVQGIVRHMSMFHDKFNVEPEQYVVKTLLDISYKCNICSKQCYLSKTCSNHRPLASVVRTFQIDRVSNDCEDHQALHVCSECERKHEDCQALWSHVFLEHKSSFFKCNLCPPNNFLSTNKRFVLSRHMLRVHKKSISRKIMNPRKTFSDDTTKSVEKQYWKELEQNCQIEIEGIIRFQCPQCPSLLKTFWILKDHLNIHTSERKYVCEQCGAFFLHKSSLVAHKTTHSNVKFKCEQCGKHYSHRNHLRYHVATVHENKWKSAVCDVCGRVFLDSRNMRKHAAVHSTERPFVCQLCGAAYKWKKHLVRHQKNCNDNSIRC